MIACRRVRGSWWKEKVGEDGSGVRRSEEMQMQGKCDDTGGERTGFCDCASMGERAFVSIEKPWWYCSGSSGRDCGGLSLLVYEMIDRQCS